MMKKFPSFFLFSRIMETSSRTKSSIIQGLACNFLCLTGFFFMLTQKGKDVILYNVYRDHGSPVAKATILSIDRRNVVGGQEMGPEYCEVVVNYVIKGDAILPRGVGDMTTMGQAQGRCIAWPYKHLEVDKSMEKAGMRPQAS